MQTFDDAPAVDNKQVGRFLRKTLVCAKLSTPFSRHSDFQNCFFFDSVDSDWGQKAHKND